MKKPQKLAAALLISLSVLQARAELLLNQVPANAIGFAAWQGSMGPGYEGSTFQQVIAASGLWQRLAQMKDGPKKDDIAAAQMFFGSPSVFYLLKMDQDQAKNQCVLVSKIGPMAQSLAAKINEDKKPNLNARDQGDLLILEIGKDTRHQVDAGGISAQPAFQAAAGQAGSQPAAMIYVDCEKVLRNIDAIVSQRNNANDRRGWAMVSDVLAIDGFKQFFWTGSFAGKAWETQTFLAMGPNRTGLPAFFDSKPLSPGAMSVAPTQAPWQGIARFDATRFINDLRDGVSRVDPNAGQQMDASLQMGKQMMGFDIENDLAASLGDEWTYFAVSTEGKFYNNIVLTNTLRNADAAARVLPMVGKFIGAQMSRQGGGAKGFESRTVDGLELNVLTLPDVSPTWAIEEGKLLFALNPDAILTARKQLSGANDSSKSQNESPAALVQKIHPGPITSYSYTDLAKVAPITYENLKKEIMQKQPAAGAELLPPLEAIIPLLAPAYSASWQDEAGWHSSGREPFPFAAIVGENMLIRMQQEAATQPGK